MIRALFSTRLVQGAILSKVCTTLGFVGSRHGSWMYTRMWQPIDHGSELYPEDVRQLPDYKICEGKHTPTSLWELIRCMMAAIVVRPIRHLSHPERFVYGKPVFR